eukprot:TRINITY_DN1695_c0_g1_i1.p1 TRINITY_DN1695_c0_g1~~TRINITY_DN1695_c0_g1_i1.p1  ORF type:complete len:216 (-),score=80.86 TRINITY_DN1695_c0_g1_i1:170-766(-)
MGDDGMHVPMPSMPPQLLQFWQQQIQENHEGMMDFKKPKLPFARIRKIMKADEEVRMISADAPVFFAKACELFILDLTIRAFLHTQDNKRKTLQRNDIAVAISKNDVFDFLIDIVPRDELTTRTMEEEAPRASTMPAEYQQYYLSMLQQQQNMGQVAPEPEMMYGHPQQVYGYYPQGQMVVQPPPVDNDHKEGQDTQY